MCYINRSVRFTETIGPGDKTAVRFTCFFNNDVINKNTAVRFNWFQPWFQNSFETFETTSGSSFQVWVLHFPDKIWRGSFKSKKFFQKFERWKNTCSTFDNSVMPKSRMPKTVHSRFTFQFDKNIKQIEQQQRSSYLVFQTRIRLLEHKTNPTNLVPGYFQ